MIRFKIRSYFPVALLRVKLGSLTTLNIDIIYSTHMFVFCRYDRQAETETRAANGEGAGELAGVDVAGVVDIRGRAAAGRATQRAGGRVSAGPRLRVYMYPDARLSHMCAPLYLMCRLKLYMNWKDFVRL